MGLRHHVGHEHVGQTIETPHKPAGTCEASDVVDMPFYGEPRMFAANSRRASFLGEFGGLGHEVSGHVWLPDHPTAKYGDCDTLEKLEAAYLDQMEKVGRLAAKGLAGSVYTQTTDVENEVNGLMTYDRKVLKLKPEVLKAAHDRIIASALGGNK